jgi:hypothetical protein
LQNIISDENKRKKLIVYINPPYAEVSSLGKGGKAGVNQSSIHNKYISKLETAGRELYTQFIARIYYEIPSCVIANFSKLKTLQGSAFDGFRSFFHAKLEKLFVVPANSFDNVKGNFPIGFQIWNTSKEQKFKKIAADVFSDDGNFIGKKYFYSYDKSQFINKWITSFKNNSEPNIGFLAGTNGNDFQHNNIVYILNDREQMANPRGIWITQNNLIPACIYFAVRKVVPATWLNDRDQFLYPNDEWENDEEFHNDCLTYTIFNNNISCKHGINHWIPFIEWDVESHNRFDSHFMTDFFKGETEEFIAREPQLFYDCGKGGGASGGATHKKKAPRKFSKAAKDVFKAGKELWKYYHKQPKCNANASLYDIKEFFQGRSDKGKMNNKSEDEKYNEFMGNLRLALKGLAEGIEPKVYEYGFLRG